MKGSKVLRQRYLDPRGTQTLNLRIHTECSNHMSYRGQTFPIFRTPALVVEIFCLLNGKCTQALFTGYVDLRRVCCFGPVDVFPYLVPKPAFAMKTCEFMNKTCIFDALITCPAFSRRNLDICISLQWRQDERNGVSNHQPHECLLNRLFKSQLGNLVTWSNNPSNLYEGISGISWIEIVMMLVQSLQAGYSMPERLYLKRILFGLPCESVLSAAWVSDPWWQTDWTKKALRLQPYTCRGYICTPHRGLQILGGWLE